MSPLRLNLVFENFKKRSKLYKQTLSKTHSKCRNDKSWAGCSFSQLHELYCYLSIEIRTSACKYNTIIALHYWGDASWSMSALLQSLKQIFFKKKKKKSGSLCDEHFKEMLASPVQMLASPFPCLVVSWVVIWKTVVVALRLAHCTGDSVEAATIGSTLSRDSMKGCFLVLPS